MGGKVFFKIITIGIIFTSMVVDFTSALELVGEGQKLGIVYEKEACVEPTINELPSFKSIQIISIPEEGKSYVAGEVITVQAEVDNSELNNENISLIFKLQDGDKNINFNILLKYNTQLNMFVGDYQVDKNINIGNYICNEAYTWKSSEPGGLNVKLPNDLNLSIGCANDIVAPTLKSFKVDKHKVTVGDIVNYEFKIDDESSIESIELDFALVSTWKVDEFKDIQPVFNKAEDKYTGSFKITEKMYSGEYNVCTIKVIDKYKNQLYLMNSKNEYSGFNTQESGLSAYEFGTDSAFEVYGTEIIDITPPVIKSINISNSNPKIGEEVLITADVYDDESNIKYVQFLYDTYRSGFERKFFYLMLEYNPKTKLYEKKIQVNKFFQKEKITLTSIEVANDVEVEMIPRVAHIYDIDILSKFDILVVGDAIGDTEAPIIRSVTCDKEYGFIGDKLKVSLDAYDEKSGIASVLIAANGGGPFSVMSLHNFSYNEVNKKYEAELELNDNMYSHNVWGEDNEWRFWGLSVSDYNSNHSGSLLDQNMKLKVFSDDLNSDNKCDVLDLSILATKYNCKSGESNWNRLLDFNSDKIIDIYDLVILSKRIK